MPRIEADLREGTVLLLSDCEGGSVENLRLTEVDTEAEARPRQFSNPQSQSTLSEPWMAEVFVGPDF